MLLCQRLGKLMSPQAYYNTLSELIWLEPREAKCCSKHCVSSDASVGSPSHLLNPFVLTWTAVFLLSPWIALTEQLPRWITYQLPIHDVVITRKILFN